MSKPKKARQLFKACSVAFYSTAMNKLLSAQQVIHPYT